MAKSAFYKLVGVLFAAMPAAMASEPVAPALKSAELTRCNGFNDPKAAWEAVAAGAEQPLPLRSLTPPVLLPDGREFRTWEQSAEHGRTFFVAQRHPQASDDNPGSEARPWKTIGRAVAALEPGDRVVVRQGLYREWVRPARGGTGPNAMITYQAAPGEEVIVSGSEPLAGRWTPSTPSGQSPLASAWMIELPAPLLDGYNPFAERNISDAMSDNPYNRGGWDKPPYTLPRGLVFQDGRRLLQVAEYAELAQADGAYWVEPGGRRLHVRPCQDQPPAKAAFDVTTRPFAFAPEQAGLGFIRVDGFVVERVANCVPVPQLGAISTMQGHHWIVENNVVRQVNGLGLDYGRRQTFIPYEVPADTPYLAGVGTIVRGNTFLECGVSALSGLGLIGGLVEDNYSRDCGWRRVQGLAESGGIKLHYLKHTLVRRNAVQGTTSAAGLWVDHSNHNSRITQNIVFGAEGNAFFLEASYGPNLVDHNIFWGSSGDGMLLTHTGHATIAHNLVGCCRGLPVRIAPARPLPTGRMIDLETKRFSASDHNRLIGNVFYGFESRTPLVPADMDNVSDWNVFVNPPDGKPFDLAAWHQKTGYETHSQAATSSLEFLPAEWKLRGLLPTLACPRIPAVTSDYFAAVRSDETTEAGPFVKFNLKPETVPFTAGAGTRKLDGAVTD